MFWETRVSVPLGLMDKAVVDARNIPRFGNLVRSNSHNQEC